MIIARIFCVGAYFAIIYQVTYLISPIKYATYYSGGSMKNRMIIFLLIIACILAGGCAASEPSSQPGNNDKVTYGAKGANPYLPLWEHIPDGEPRLFDGRVYIYGSHDTAARTIGGTYCGRDHVTWSAPEDNLLNWRHDGVIVDITDLQGTQIWDYSGSASSGWTKTNIRNFTVGSNARLFAPDCVYNPKSEKYYLYVFTNSNSPDCTFVLSSDSPTGPFTDPKYVPCGKGPMGSVGQFDPGVFVDVDNPHTTGEWAGWPRVYIFWGFERNAACELDPTDMATPIPGTLIQASSNHLVFNGHPEGARGFFEGASMRKVGDFYVYIYADRPTDPSSLTYVYNKTGPMDPFKHGGVIVNNQGEVITNPYTGAGNQATNIGNNTHGSLLKIKGQWYIFYHRHTQNTTVLRQAMVEPVQVIFEDDGETLTIPRVEMTSQGFAINGLNPFHQYDAGIACYFWPNNSNSDGVYIDTHTYDPWDYSADGYEDEKQWNPVVNLRNRSWVGWKYFNFGSDKTRKLKLVLTIKDNTIPATVNVYQSDPKKSFYDTEKPKTKIGAYELTGDNPNLQTITIPVQNMTGKKGIYLEFLSDTVDKEICKLNNLEFIR